MFTFALHFLQLSLIMRRILLTIIISLFSIVFSFAQLNTSRIMDIGRNSIYFEDYVLSIQYFNQVIKIKPYLAEPYFYRAIAKLSLDDYQGALEDANLCIERNPFIVNAYQVRGIARQNLDDYKGAIEDYNSGLKYDPENKTFLLNKAIAYAQLKDYDNALESFSQTEKIHPSYYNLYMSRSALYMEKGDTLAALKDMDKAISIDKYYSYAYAQRGMIKASLKNYNEALEDMDKAIKMDPDYTSYYINRGLVKYYLNDLRGTMSDYDRVINLDKNNLIAYYNRGLLRAQVGDRNRAIEDFSNVIRLEPENSFAYYNRAILNDEIGDYKNAIKDYTKVLEQYPNFVPALYARSESKRHLNDLKNAEADFMAAYELEKKLRAEKEAKKNNPDLAKNDDTDDSNETEAEKVRKESDKNIQKFKKILIADNDNSKQKYSSSIRGRIQDKNVDADLQSSFILSFYEKEDKVKDSNYFEKSVSDFNKGAFLLRNLIPTNDEPALTSDQIDEHFASIDSYSKKIELNPNAPISYFGRSMDFMLVQDFQSAIDDLNRVLLIRDDFVLGYFNRAAIRMKQIETSIIKGEDNSSEENNNMKLNLIASLPSKGSIDNIKKNNSVKENLNTINFKKLEFEMVLRDYDKVVQMDPNFIYAYFNRANVYCMQKDYAAAILDLNKAIDINPEFAEALFNRGLVYIYQGKTELGINDLSKAGELGVVEAYNLLKRLKD